VEVSDTTLRRDRGVKRPLYASAGIAEYWIVNLEDRYVEVHWSPAGDTFASVERNAVATSRRSRRSSPNARA